MKPPEILRIGIQGVDKGISQVDEKSRVLAWLERSALEMKLEIDRLPRIHISGVYLHPTLSKFFAQQSIRERRVEPMDWISLAEQGVV